jgi:hypothetical protein
MESTIRVMIADDYPALRETGNSGRASAAVTAICFPNEARIPQTPIRHCG